MVCKNLCERVGIVGGYNGSLYMIKDLSIVKLPLFSYTQQLIITKSTAFAAVRSCVLSQGIITERIGRGAQNAIEGWRRLSK